MHISTRPDRGGRVSETSPGDRSPKSSPLQSSRTRCGRASENDKVRGASSQLSRHTTRRPSWSIGPHAQARRPRIARPSPVGGCSLRSTSSSVGCHLREVVARQDHPAAWRRWRWRGSGTLRRAVAGQHDRVRIVPPQPAVLPVAAAGSAAPCAATRSHVRLMSFELREPWTRPSDGHDRVVAAEDERVSRAPTHRLHAAAVGFDPRGARVVEPPAVDRAPEVRVELEVGAAPLRAHGAEDGLEVGLRLGVGAVERVPGAAPPAAEGHAVRAQGRPSASFTNQSGCCLEDVRALLGDERRHPDRGLEPARADLLQHALHVAAERRLPSPASRPSPAGSRRRSGCTGGRAISRAMTSRLREHLVAP